MKVGWFCKGIKNVDEGNAGGGDGRLIQTGSGVDEGIFVYK